MQEDQLADFLGRERRQASLAFQHFAQNRVGRFLAAGLADDFDGDVLGG